MEVTSRALVSTSSAIEGSGNAEEKEQPSTVSGSKWGPLLPENWLVVCEQADSASVYFLLSRLNKTFYDFLIPERAKQEAILFAQFHSTAGLVGSIPPTIRGPHVSMLSLAIHRGWSLDAISAIIHAYISIEYVYGYHDDNACLTNTAIMKDEPPLFQAVRMNRLDVIDKLAEVGCSLDWVWGGNMGACGCMPHMGNECRTGVTSCMNAICIAKDAGKPEMVKELLLRGVEDFGRDRPWQFPSTSVAALVAAHYT